MRTSAKELVGLRPDAIFGVTTPVIGALARETRTIPIVFTSVSDPIGSGFAATLRIRAATSPASRSTIPQRAVNGCSY
jgi:ABC-type uncharacterized transport system substrate-binding protein